MISIGTYNTYIDNTYILLFKYYTEINFQLNLNITFYIVQKERFYENVI